MDLDWVAAFLNDYEWLIEYLKNMVKPAAALAVVLLAVALSYSQNLSLEGEMIYSVFRSFLQLSVIGFVLQFIFDQENAGWIVLAYLFMVFVAGYTAGQRANHVPRGKYVAGVSILAGTGITMFLLVVLNVFPFTPRYMIPVAGMMVGNAMTVVGVTMKQLRDDIKMQLNLVETALALGATPRQATLQQVKRALVTSLSPVLDSCKTVGLISLPGAMTGMIMGGASPLEAIQLQIVVMNMIVGAATAEICLLLYFFFDIEREISLSMRNDAKDEASSSEEVVVSAADPESIKVCRETTYHLRRIGEDNGRYSVRVVGAGQMGSGIAQLATNGLDVWLMDALESPQLSPLSIVSSPKA